MAGLMVAGKNSIWITKIFCGRIFLLLEVSCFSNKGKLPEILGCNHGFSDRHSVVCLLANCSLRKNTILFEKKLRWTPVVGMRVNQTPCKGFPTGKKVQLFRSFRQLVRMQTM